MPSTKFTDNNLKVLYHNLLNHHKNSNTKDINQLHDEMYSAVYYSLESSIGSLYHLERNEKVKVYQAFNAIFYALPTYRELSLDQKLSFKPKRPTAIQVNYIYPPYYQDYNNTLLTWMALSSMTQYPCGGYIPTGTVHTHPSADSHDLPFNDVFQLIVAAIVVILLAIAAIVAFMSLYYMLSQFVDSVERFWFNEGWLKAALMLSTSVGCGAATSALSLTLAAPLLASLAVIAGFNPVAVVIVATVCFTIAGAGIATLITSLIYDAATKNKEAMDPDDSLRFRLTEADETRLISKSIDPVKVKCAMVALRAEIASIQGNNNSVPSYFSRHFFGGTNVQPLLDQVRGLRSGKIDCIRVGNMIFNCSIPQGYQSGPAVDLIGQQDAYFAYVEDLQPKPCPSAPAAVMSSQPYPAPMQYGSGVYQ